MRWIGFIFALVFISIARAADPPIPIEITAAQFSPDSRKILFIDCNNAPHSLDIVAGLITNVVHLPSTENPRTSYFSADGKFFVTFTESLEEAEDEAAATFHAVIYDVEKAKLVCEFTSEFQPRIKPAFSPDGKFFLIATDKAGALLHEVATGKLIHQLRANRHRVCSASFSPDGKTVITAGMGGTVQTWDVQTGKVLLNRRLGNRTNSLAAFLPDGKSFLTHSAGDYAYYDAATGEPIERPVPAAVTNTFDISPDGNILLISNFGGITLFDLSTAKEITQLAGNFGDFDSISISPDSKTVLITQDGACTLHSAATLGPLATLHLLTDSNWAVTTLLGNYDASFEGNAEVLPYVLKSVPADPKVFKSKYHKSKLLSQLLK